MEAVAFFVPASVRAKSQMTGNKKPRTRRGFLHLTQTAEPKSCSVVHAELLLHGALELTAHFFTVLLGHLQSSLRVALSLVSSVQSL